MGFLKKLQEVQEKELSQEELEQITGGKGLANKLATAAFLLATVVLPTAMQSTSVEENKFHERLTYLANLDVEQYMIKLNRKIVKGDIANFLDAIEKAMNFWLGSGAFNNEMDKLGIIDADLQSARRKSIILKKILIKLNKESEIKKHNEYNCLRYLFSQLRGRFENACKGAKEFAQKSLHAMNSFAFQKKQEVPYNCDEILRRFNGNISFSCNEGNFKLDKKGLNLILNGEFDEMDLLTGGGHTKGNTS